MPFTRNIVVVALVLAVGFTAAILGPLYFEPRLTGRWCPDDAIWRDCYREWLNMGAAYVAAIGGIAVLLFLAGQLNEQRKALEHSLEPHARLVERESLTLVSIIRRERDDLEEAWASDSPGHRLSNVKAVLERMARLIEAESAQKLRDYMSGPEFATLDRVTKSARDLAWDLETNKQALMSTLAYGTKPEHRDQVDAVIAELDAAVDAITTLRERGP